MKTLEAAQIGVCIVGMAFLGAGTYQVLRFDLAPTTVKLNAAIDSANSTLVAINRPCPGPQDKVAACGTLADLNRTLATVRGTFGVIEVAANHEDKQLATLDAQERQLFADIHKTIESSNTTLQAVTQTAQSAAKVLDTANATIADLQPVEEAVASTAKHVDAVVADQNIPVMMANTQRITADAARITKDAADEADKLAHPNKKKLGFWGTMDATMIWIHSHVIPPIF